MIRASLRKGVRMIITKMMRNSIMKARLAPEGRGSGLLDGGVLRL